MRIPSKSWLNIAVLALSSAMALHAVVVNKQNLPAGTVLPIELNSTLKSKGSKPGEKIEGKLKQEVRLPSGLVIKAGSSVTGHVLEVSHAAAGFRIVVQFDQLQDEHDVIPLNVSLRALASSQDVYQAGIPVGPSSDSVSSGGWVTQQVGGDYVFRGRGYVSSDTGKVGIWNGSGVWGRLMPGGDCTGGDNNNAEQSFWIFSTTACGVYGIRDLKLSQAGRAAPLGHITLESPKEILIRGGSGWLLVVNSPAGNATAAK